VADLDKIYHICSLVNYKLSSMQIAYHTVICVITVPCKHKPYIIALSLLMSCYNNNVVSSKLVFVKDKKFSYRRGTARHAMSVNSCYNSQAMGMGVI